MDKQVHYAYTIFPGTVLEEATQLFQAYVGHDEELDFDSLTIQTTPSVTWSHDAFTTWLTDYEGTFHSARATIWADGVQFLLSIRASPAGTDVKIRATTRDDIEALFRPFERRAKQHYNPPLPPSKPVPPRPRIFIGHGRSSAWRDLKDHLQDQHGLDVVAYETGARAGLSITDVLGRFRTQANFALLVMTAEDETATGTVRARQNVVHETGLMQGVLGFDRAIMLLEEGVEEYTNVAGVQYLPFRQGGISSTYGDVLATLRREFPLTL